jgi:hypothetical protein
MDTTNCAKCGAPLSPTAVLYDEHGTVLCQPCLLRAEAAASHAKVAGKVKAVAYAGPVVGLAAFFWNPLFLISVAAIGNGIYVFKSLRDAETAARLSTAAEKMKVAAIAGMVLGGLTAMLRLLQMMGKFAE